MFSGCSRSNSAPLPEAERPAAMQAFLSPAPVSFICVYLRLRSVCFQEGEHLLAEAPPRLVVQRLDGAGERRAFCRRQFHHFAARAFDRLARGLLFIDGKIALRGDGLA